MQLFRIINKWVVIAPFVIGLPLTISCNKLLDAGSPANKVITPKVYTSDSLAQAALIGVYYKMMYSFGPFNGHISRYCGLAADELNRTTPLETDQPFLTNTLTPDNKTIWSVWTNIYSYIYQCNDIIEGLTGANTITPSLRNQLSGEAYFLRALCYFYLVNLYGNVPLALGTDYTKNTSIPRAAANTVYARVVEDLISAKNLLTDEYVTTPGYPAERVRANRLAAQALLARIHLFRNEWTKAAEEATAVIGSGVYELEDNLAQTFNYNSREAILQFMTIMEAYNTAEGAMFVPVNPNGRPAFILTDTFMQKIEPGDARRLWIRTVTVNGKEYNSPHKYKLNTNVPREEYNIVLRLAELYCIRAEALAMQDRLTDALSDLNKIRKRAGLPDLATITSQSQALAAIEQERRVEFFAEWGHRWFDLKRLPAHTATHPNEKRIDEVMGNCRPLTWKSTAALWPISSFEIIRNPALTQNEGYQ